MANVLTNLAADIYKAADVVGRELVGFIPAVTVNGDAVTRAAKGDTIRSHFTRTPTVSTSFAPAMTIPEGTDQTVDNKTMVVDTFATVQIPWTGEDMKHVNNGSGFETIYGDQIRQAMRAICNTIELSLFNTAYKAASRAVGTAGTTPFATTIDPVADVRKILVDNGCPMDGAVSLVMNTAAGTALRKVTNLYKVNESGGSDMLRQGVLLDLQGIMLRESAQISQVTKGTGASYTTNTAGYAVGATDIAIITGGTVIVNGPTNNGNGALDVNGTFTISGGTLVALGSSGMAETPDATSTQGWLQAAPSGQAGAVVQIKSGSTVIAEFTATKAFANVVYSSSAITKGQQYVVSVNGAATTLTAGTAAAGGGMGGGRR